MQFSEWNWELALVIAAVWVLSIVMKRRKRRKIGERMDALAQAFGAQVERVDETRYRIETELDGMAATIAYGAYLESGGPPRKVARWSLTCTIPVRRVSDIYNISFYPKKNGTYRMISKGFEPREGALDGSVHDALSAWSRVAAGEFRLYLEGGKLIAWSDYLIDVEPIVEAAQLQARVARELELALSR